MELSNDMLRFKRVLFDMLRKQLKMSDSKAQDIVDSYDYDTLANMVKMRMSPKDVIDDIRAERGFETGFGESTMKLTKDTLIEGQIIKEGVEIRIVESDSYFDEEEYKQELQTHILDILGQSRGIYNGMEFDIDSRSGTVVFYPREGIELYATPYFEDGGMDFLVMSGMGDIIYSDYNEPILSQDLRDDTNSYFTLLNKSIDKAKKI